MSKKGRIEIYKSKTGNKSQRWRWRIVASNGRALAASSEGFQSKAKVLKNFYRVADVMKAWPVEVL